MAFRKTNAMCMVYIDGKNIDMGNYFINEATGERMLITSRELAEKYAKFVNVDVYIYKTEISQ